MTWCFLCSIWPAMSLAINHVQNQSSALWSIEVNIQLCRCQWGQWGCRRKVAGWGVAGATAQAAGFYKQHFFPSPPLFLFFLSSSFLLTFPPLFISSPLFPSLSFPFFFLSFFFLPPSLLPFSLPFPPPSHLPSFLLAFLDNHKDHFSPSS